MLDFWIIVLLLAFTIFFAFPPLGLHFLNNCRAITILSFGLDLFAMSTLGQSIVVPLLASLEVAENQIFAPYFLGENFHKVLQMYFALAPVLILLKNIIKCLTVDFHVISF